MTSDPFAPVSASGVKPASADQWTAIVPVPADAPPPPARHAKLGQPSANWRYVDAHGRLLFVAARFDRPDGKEFLPASYCRNEATGKRAWRWKGLPEPRPLYRLDALAARPDAPVIVCEGEKAADAAAKLFPDHVATTSPNGSKSARKADWSPLAGRRVIVWPDADEPGAAYAETVAELLAQAGAASITVIEPEKGLASGFDAADASEQGWTAERLSALLSGAKVRELPAPDTGADKNEAGGAKSKGRKRPALDLDALLDGIECWRDEDGEPHVTIQTGEEIFEHWGARHKRLKAYLSGRHYQKTGSALSASGLEDIIRTIEALCYCGPQYKTWRRIGRDGDCVYFDLCDAGWKSVKIARHGWVVGSFPAAKFLRSPAMRPLPVPVLGGGPGELWPYVNCGSEEDFTLLIGWLVGALNPAGPYLILNLSGEAGSGKSSISELLGNLIDPEVGKKRAVNRDERDMLVAARNAHVLCYDNLSGVSHSLSDSLCRLSTGGGLSARQLHSDADVVILEAMRPLVLNGIDTGGRQDLVDRSISLFLPRLPDAGRRSERELKAEFEAVWPVVLGSLLSGVAAGLRNIDRVKLDSLPRMADAAIWIEACLPGLGIEQGAFISAYEKNRATSKKMLIESDPVGSEIVRIIREHRPMGFIGSASVLLDLLNEHAPQTAKSMRAWPSTPAACGVAVRRAGELLRAEGFEWGDQRNAEGRKIKISPISPAVDDGQLPD